MLFKGQVRGKAFPSSSFRPESLSQNGDLEGKITLLIGIENIYKGELKGFIRLVTKCTYGFPSRGIHLTSKEIK
jgi:hypothetical protein